MEGLIMPPALKRGDRIAIVSPASSINPDYVAGAAKVLKEYGLEPVVAPHALGQHGSYSGTVGERLNDMTDALLDPSVRAILCSRGGYGAVHLLDSLSKLPLHRDPKWLIGFSDISALHALMGNAGIASIHGPMAKHTALGTGHLPVKSLLDIIGNDRQKPEPLLFDNHDFNRKGTARGTLRGGNLAVLADLIATPYDMLRPGSILFIEDIAEPVYKVERILYQLRLSGVLSSLKGLIVGRFTEYKPDRNHHSMEEMIRDIVADYDYPVTFNAPIGHIDDNMPVIESVPVELEVTAGGTSLTYL